MRKIFNYKKDDVIFHDTDYDDKHYALDQKNWGIVNDLKNQYGSILEVPDEYTIDAMPMKVTKEDTHLNYEIIRDEIVSFRVNKIEYTIIRHGGL